MIKKTIRIFKHPYAFDINVTFGTFEQMIENAVNKYRWDGYQIAIGGDFNKEISKRCGRRASFLEIGVQLELKESRASVTLDNVEKAYAICQCRWEGVYWKCSYFDEDIKNGLYPVTADWNGKTYIERWTYKGYNKYGVPIVGEKYYEQTDTFRY